MRHMKPNNSAADGFKSYLIGLDPGAAPISKGDKRTPIEIEGAWREPFGTTTRWSPSNATYEIPPASVQDEIEPGSQQSFDRRSGFTPRKKIHRRDTVQGPWILNPALQNPQEDWGNTSYTRSS
ncbi:hypothetical protein AYI70_g10925 [Smittium culicis]|uniref:Uncharacterized protein n=1 Tax=Smittium culicis TaxID=133412 RepID=A0A1R1X476_9FUNG|nr:hypothetical protein AYI70_g10925 [Smittium culicis]